MSRSSNPSPEALRRIEDREAKTIAGGFRRAAEERDYQESLTSGVAADLRRMREEREHAEVRIWVKP